VRQSDLPRIIAALRTPLQDFVHESRVRIVLLISGAGQVLAQHGFTRSYEVMNVASLAAAACSAAGALAQMTDARRWTHMHQAGKEQQLFIAPVRTPGADLILVAIFDRETSLGIVQLFFDRLGTTVGGLAEFQQRLEPATQQSFERDLEAGLQRVLTDHAPSEG
jgi:predicted regulator of Ras-like GTPase activity (Roadblock/LC7/MglB family)